MPDLTGNAIIDLAVGLSFLYFLLSIVCSAINEGVATTFNLRAKDLERGIGQLLEDPADFYKSWRVQALHKPSRFLSGLPLVGKAFSNNKPSYIPSRVFALTVLETFAPPTGAAASHDLVARAQGVVGGIGNTTVQGLLQDALDEARGDVDKFRAALERSFDETMERVSGWYKRRVQLILFVTAIIVVAGVNADSFTIGQRLWKDEALRAAVVAQANKTVAEASTECGTSDDAAPAETAAACVDKVKQLGIPVGWSTATSPHGWGIAGKVFGLLLTVFAVQLGAPFWFDLLGKVARLRGSGTPPATGK